MGRDATEKICRENQADLEDVQDAVILLTDVRGYSSLGEQYKPSEIYAFLNPMFKLMNEELEKAGGTILEFVGDCIIVVFNTFRNQKSGIADILYHSAECLKRIRVLGSLLVQAELPEISIGIGINKGPVAFG